MVGKRAVELFRSRRYNCGQAVLKAFEGQRDVPEALVDEFRAYGNGRAKGGLCGALHAAQRLVDDQEKRKDLEQIFAAEAGSLLCREIRRLGKLPCQGCVESAARLVSDSDLQSGAAP